MVRTFKVRLNAAHPELPLMEATAIVGSASTAFIYGVPASIGSWHITKVYVQATYPDESEVTIEARVGAEGIYTATIPMTMYSGRTRSGFVVLADGIDEGGDPVTGYVLGIADFAVYTKYLEVGHGTVAGATLHYFNIAPTVAKEGDVATVDGVLKLYNGSAWIPFTDIDLTDYYTKAETNSAIQSATAGLLPKTDVVDPVTASATGKAADALKVKERIALNNRGFNGSGYSDWSYSPDWVLVLDSSIRFDRVVYNEGYWIAEGHPDGIQAVIVLSKVQGAADALTVTFPESDYISAAVVATRTALKGYVMGDPADNTNPNKDKPVAKQEDLTAAEQAIAAKYTKPAGGIPSTDMSEAVQTSLAKADSALQSAPVSSVNTKTGAVTLYGSDVAMSSQDATTVAAAIAAKYAKPNDGIPKTDLASGVQTSLDKADAALPGTGGTMTGGLTTPNLTVGARYAGSTIGTNSVAAGGENEASGNHSFANGANTKAKGNFSHAEGVNTEATGGYQHADGSYNDPHTVLSGTAEQIAAGTALWMLGFGTSSSDKKNAVETMRNGKTFIYGVGGYDGTNPTGSGVVDIAAFLNALPSAGDLRYSLGTTITATATLADRTMNNVAPAADNTQNIVLSFPAAVTGKARDFCALVTNTTGNTGTISFSPPSGATIYGDGFGTIPASGETYLYNVMEIAANTFFTKAVKMETPA